MCRRNVMSAERLEVSILGAGPVVRLKNECMVSVEMTAAGHKYVSFPLENMQG